jgi:hypothetical protein
MAAKEGWKSLFKGMSYPLLASGVQVIAFVPIFASAATDSVKQNAITFRAYSVAARWLSRSEEESEGTRSAPAKPQLSSEFFAGSCAGLTQCFVTIPMEVLKIRAQLQEKVYGSPGYVGPAAQLAGVLRHEGLAGS